MWLLDTNSVPLISLLRRKILTSIEDWTLLMCVPRCRCVPLQVLQISTPKLREAQSGLGAPQSAHRSFPGTSLKRLTTAFVGPSGGRRIAGYSGATGRLGRGPKSTGPRWGEDSRLLVWRWCGSNLSLPRLLGSAMAICRDIVYH